MGAGTRRGSWDCSCSALFRSRLLIFLDRLCSKWRMNRISRQQSFFAAVLTAVLPVWSILFSRIGLCSAATYSSSTVMAPA